MRFGFCIFIKTVWSRFDYSLIIHHQNKHLLTLPEQLQVKSEMAHAGVSLWFKSVLGDKFDIKFDLIRN